MDIESSPPSERAQSRPLVAEKECPILNVCCPIDVFSFWIILLLSLSFAALSDRS
jgi:hypothetical protein